MSVWPGGRPGRLGDVVALLRTLNDGWKTGAL